jgi:hypothetical protein
LHIVQQRMSVQERGQMGAASYAFNAFKASR